jgi:ribosomal protein L16 Arg81 hydroxylase
MITLGSAATAARLDSAARRWLAENLMLGSDMKVLTDTLTATGYDRAEAQQEAEAIVASPIYQAGQWVTGRLRKSESLLNVYRQLSSLTDPPGTIERRSPVTADEFLHGYYARNRPVILTGLARGWPAYRLWTPDYLRGRCADEEVEVMNGRESDDRYEVNSESHRERIRFADYVDRVTSTANSNDSYLVANNHFLESPGTRGLLDDLQILPEFLEPAPPGGSVFLWFGPGGTVTPLHHDALNVLLVQIRGHKRVTLIPSVQLPLVYNDIAVYSEVRLEEVDEARYPLFAAADRIELTLEAGDAIFIPVGWWHHVRSLDVAISTSFTGFAFPNDYPWQHPDVRR